MNLSILLVTISLSLTDYTVIYGYPDHLFKALCPSIFETLPCKNAKTGPSLRL